MHAAGLAEVTRAKTDGRWEAAYAGQASIEVPADLAATLAAEPTARTMFDILTSQNRSSGIKSRYDTARSLQGVGALTKISPLEGHPVGTSRPSARSAEPPPPTDNSSPTR